MITKRNLYCVKATIGEFEGRANWKVASTFDKKLANDLSGRMNDWVRHQIESIKSMGYENSQEVLHVFNKLFEDQIYVLSEMSPILAYLSCGSGLPVFYVEEIKINTSYEITIASIEMEDLRNFLDMESIKPFICVECRNKKPLKELHLDSDEFPYCQSCKEKMQ